MQPVSKEKLGPRLLHSTAHVVAGAGMQGALGQIISDREVT